MALEIYFRSQELAANGYPNLGGASNRGEPAQLPDISREDAWHHLDNAWRNLLLDFRERIARGRLIVRGVEARPKRRVQRGAIPGQWAADFKIDALNNTIEIDDERYIAVTVSSAAEEAARASADSLPPSDAAPLLLAFEIPELPGGAEGGAVPLELPETEEADVAAAKTGNPRSSRGRPPSTSLIEDDLRANWDAVQRRVAQRKGSVPNWSELASAMAKRFARITRQQGQLGQQALQTIPHKNTIRKRLPEIYQRVMDEKTAR